MSDAQRQALAQEVRGLADSLVVQLSRLEAQPYLAQLAGNDAYAENGVFYPTRDSLLSAVGHSTTMFTSLGLAWDGAPRITVLSPDAAVFSGTFHEAAQPASGGPAMNLHGIWTGVYQRVNGRWSIVQAHESWTPDQPEPKK
jgi:hypothetical protein